MATDVAASIRGPFPAAHPPKATPGATLVGRVTPWFDSRNAKGPCRRFLISLGMTSGGWLIAPLLLHLLTRRCLLAIRD
jgi:hypothetical protein